MAYSELIKDFGKIRDYMRQFYIYGFRGRGEMGDKSARSYDNEKRRIESWLGEYMSFRQEASGKKSFISMESKEVLHNPLYKAFKAKSFTDNDIMLHFYIMDILEGGAYSVGEIADIISDDYLVCFDEAQVADESTIRKKLKEYEELGLVNSSKEGRRIVYQKSQDQIDLEKWQPAVEFFSEIDPLGVVGSYVLDRCVPPEEKFTYKHHYLLHALESQVLCQLLSAMAEYRNTEIQVHSERSGMASTHKICPLKVYVSTQTGRRYLLAYNFSIKNITVFRMDNIKAVVEKEVEPKRLSYLELAEYKEAHMWGISMGNSERTDHVEMTLQIEEGADHILNRLCREKRMGHVDAAGERLYKFTADVYDAWELVPWMRTFMGRIVAMKTTNAEVQEAFYEDMAKMVELYGGDEDVV